MILEIKDPGWDFSGMFITGGVWLVGIVIMLIWTWKTRDETPNTYNENLFLLAWALTTVVGLAVFLLGGVLAGAKQYDVDVRAAKVEALAELGFDRADLSGNSFTANRDGAYFEGLLIPEKDNLTWSIAEVLTPIPVEKTP